MSYRAEARVTLQEKPDKIEVVVFVVGDWALFEEFEDLYMMHFQKGIEYLLEFKKGLDEWEDVLREAMDICEEHLLNGDIPHIKSLMREVASA